MRSLALLGAIFALFAGVASLFFGLLESFVLVAASFAAVGLGLSLGQGAVLRMQGARPLDRRAAPELWRLVERLSRSAGLSQAPRIYFQDTMAPNAFAVGTRSRSGICVSRGLLELMSRDELAAVLAHEVAHIRNGDSFSMSLAAHLAGMARALAWFGVALAVLSIPAYLSSGNGIPWLGLALLALAPTAIGLLELALSRSREFAADLTAAELTQDPAALASALGKLERLERGLLSRLLLPRGIGAAPTWLRTHPPTRERLARLAQLEHARYPAWPLPRILRRKGVMC